MIEPDAKIIAKVNNVSITEEMLKNELKSRKEENLNLNQVLHELVSRELLAQEAYKQDFYRDEQLLPVFKQILVQIFFRKMFEAEIRENSITEEELQYVWNTNNLVRTKYFHPDWFSVVDLQWFCCNWKPDNKQCETPEIKKCFEEGEKASRMAYEWIKEHGFGEDDLRNYAENNNFGDHEFIIQTYASFFNIKKKWENQYNPTILDKPVIEALVPLKQGDLSTPIKSHFGWHILFLKERVREEHKTLNDDQVKKELREMLLPQKRELEFKKYMEKLQEDYGTFINEDVFLHEGENNREEKN